MQVCGHQDRLHSQAKETAEAFSHRHGRSCSSLKVGSLLDPRITFSQRSDILESMIFFI